MMRLKTIDFHFYSKMAMVGIAVLFSLLWISGCSDDDDGTAGPAAPTITGINPESGPVGTEVTITGTNFSTTASENKVSFNDVAATVNSATATEIKAVVPENAATGPVKVTVGGQTATGPEFTVEPADGDEGVTITGIDPTSGAADDSVTITGTGFSTTLEDNSVTFTDGIAATVAKGTDTTLVVLVPEDAVTGPITVTVGENTATSPGDFTVVAASSLALDPASGAVGAEVTITGATFSATPEENVVTFTDGKVATVTTATDTSLVVSVPADAVSGPITVVVGEETFTSDIFTVTTANGLGVTSIDPAEGEAGDTINILGLGFSATVADNTISFAGETDPVPAEIVSASDTSLAVKVPAGAITGPISVTVAGETVTTAEFTLSTNGGGEGTYMVSTFAGINSNGFNDGVPAGEAAFNQPFDLAVDQEGNVYVGDTRNHRVRKIAADGSLVNTFAGGGCDDPAAGCYKDGAGAAAGFYQPSGLDFDNDGNLYVTDNQNHRLRMVSSDGTVSTVAGSGGKGVVDGTGESAQFSSPYGVYVNADGEIFVSDFAGHTIRKVTPGGEVTIYAGQANTAGQDDGEKLSATFNGPVPITGDAAGNLYVGDFGSGLVRKISADGQVTTFAGTNGEFTSPAGLAYKDGILYVADRGKNQVFKVTESGEVSVIAGTETPGGKNGEGSVAQFDGPNGLAFDNDGNLLVAEHGSNGRIRKITIQ